MSGLEMIYFIENNDIYPFIKRVDDDSKDFIQLRLLLTQDSNRAFEFSRARYSAFQKDGYSFNDINDLLSNGIEKMNYYRNDKGLDNLYHERDAFLSVYQKKKAMSKELKKC